MKSHPAYVSLASKSLGEIYSLLNKHIEELKTSRKVEFRALLTCNLHVLPFHAGNRSPYADPLLRGSVIGLTLERGVEDLALQYYATLQSLAHGVRLLLEHFATSQAKSSQLLVTGGLAVNSLWLQELADICKCEVYLPRAKDAVLLVSGEETRKGNSKRAKRNENTTISLFLDHFSLLSKGVCAVRCDCL